MILEKTSPHWWRGQLRDGSIGVFPSSFVSYKHLPNTRSALDVDMARRQRTNTVRGGPPSTNPTTAAAVAAAAGPISTNSEGVAMMSAAKPRRQTLAAPAQSSPAAGRRATSAAAGSKFAGRSSAVGSAPALYEEDVVPLGSRSEEDFARVAAAQKKFPAAGPAGGPRGSAGDFHDYVNVPNVLPPPPAAGGRGHTRSRSAGGTETFRTVGEEGLWYVGPMTRDEATALLINKPDGSYVVRASVEKGGYSISVKYEIPRHIRIRMENGLVFISKTTPFKTLDSLITHYTRESLEPSFPATKTALLYPCGTRPFDGDPEKKAGSSGIVPSGSVRGPMQRTPRAAFATALFDFTAESGDELTFFKGTRIEVLAKEGCGEGWWRGKRGGQIGLFPSSYVQLE